MIHALMGWDIHTVTFNNEDVASQLVEGELFIASASTVTPHCVLHSNKRIMMLKAHVQMLSKYAAATRRCASVVLNMETTLLWYDTTGTLDLEFEKL